MKKERLNYMDFEKEFVVIKVEVFIEIYIQAVGMREPDLCERTLKLFAKSQSHKKKRIRHKKMKECFNLMYYQIENELEIKKKLRESAIKVAELNGNALEKLSKN